MDELGKVFSPDGERIWMTEEEFEASGAIPFVPEFRVLAPAVEAEVRRIVREEVAEALQSVVTALNLNKN